MGRGAAASLILPSPHSLNDNRPYRPRNGNLAFTLEDAAAPVPMQTLTLASAPPTQGNCKDGGQQQRIR